MTAPKVPSGAAMKAANIIAADLATGAADWIDEEYVAELLEPAFAPLRAENARLREALEEIVNMKCSATPSEPCCLAGAQVLADSTLAALAATAEPKVEHETQT